MDSFGVHLDAATFLRACLDSTPGRVAVDTAAWKQFRAKPFTFGERLADATAVDDTHRRAGIAEPVTVELERADAVESFERNELGNSCDPARVLIRAATA